MAEYIQLKRRIVYRGDVFNAIDGERLKMLPKVFDSEYTDGVHDGLKKALSILANDVEDIPAADVVEVVRCRDCKYKEQNAGRYHVKLPFYCALHDEKFCDEMEFCSYGAKMDKEDT